ncbi:hypothetical protein DMB90_17840 [Raoultella planticola]|uniref:Uncharacterized protein n=1 Tax=Raoultella planticola TaxID=575 RepID=A0A5P6ABC4_RAOPL|nr:hypothetical protein DMB90_17840 [Raoultella planticola]
MTRHYRCQKWEINQAAGRYIRSHEAVRASVSATG